MAQVSDPLNEAFTVEELRRRAAGTLLTPERVLASLGSDPAPRGDYDLNPNLVDPDLGVLPTRPAAVLIPIVDRDPEATVLMTLRTEHLPNHAGQIAFPGGKLEDEDRSPGETALREAEEEIGLDRRFVEIIGFLDWYQSRTGFRIAPAVGIVSPGYTIKPDGTEVADVFEVPLRFLMSAESHQIHSRDWKGQTRYYYAMPYRDRYIWGVTAGIIRNLYDWLYG